MSKILFTEEEIIILEKNNNILRVSECSITYTDAYKRLFIEEYMAGKLSREIFSKNGFHINIIGLKRIEQSASRWKALYKTNEIIGLDDSRKCASGRPRSRDLSKKEIIERQEAKIKLLESQVELLNKKQDSALLWSEYSDFMEYCIEFDFQQLLSGVGKR